MQEPVVVGTFRSVEHNFSKQAASELRLLAGIGVEGDAHAGPTVKHLSRVRVDPNQPNLRQVHLIQEELFDQLRAEGFEVRPGDLGENITTHGIDLLGLPTGATLRVGDSALVAITGLRNPCQQIEAFRTGLLDAVRPTAPTGEVVRKAGVMGIVVHGGIVRVGDPVRTSLPSGPPIPLERV